MAIVNLRGDCRIALQNSYASYTQRESRWDVRLAGMVRVSLWVRYTAHHPSHNPLRATGDCGARAFRIWFPAVQLTWLPEQGFRKGFPEQGGGMINLPPCSELWVSCEGPSGSPRAGK